MDLSACDFDDEVVAVGVDLSGLVEWEFRILQHQEGGLNFCSLQEPLPDGTEFSATVPMHIFVKDEFGNSVNGLISWGAQLSWCLNGDCGDQVTVTRKSNLLDGRRVWTMESFAGDLASVRAADGAGVACSIPIPFKMTLTEIP